MRFYDIFFLSYRLSEAAEVRDEFLVVALRVDVEMVPQITAYGYASESPFPHLFDVV
jgi:hypothetical protein